MKPGHLRPEPRDLAVYEGARWESFARAGDMRELSRKEISSSRPKCDAARISASETAVTVELNLVEPVLPLGKALKSERVHWFDEPQLGWR